MLVKDSTLKVGGNKFKVKLGDFFKNIGEKLMDFGDNLIINNKPKLVTNPTARLVNPYTLIINFRVDNSQKYQIILQGDYKEIYKEREADNDSVTIEDDKLFMMIYTNYEIWFKKD